MSASRWKDFMLIKIVRCSRGTRMWSQDEQNGGQGTHIIERVVWGEDLKRGRKNRCMLVVFIIETITRSGIPILHFHHELSRAPRKQYFCACLCNKRQTTSINNFLFLKTFEKVMQSQTEQDIKRLEYRQQSLIKKKVPHSSCSDGHPARAPSSMTSTRECMISLKQKKEYRTPWQRKGEGIIPTCLI